jgi:hypothetical protein
MVYVLTLVATATWPRVVVSSLALHPPGTHMCLLSAKRGAVPTQQMHLVVGICIPQCITHYTLHARAHALMHRRIV